MTRISAVVVMLCALASTLGAADTRDAEVLNLVLSQVPRGSVPGMAPFLLADHTRGGGERFAEQWIKKRRGEVIGGEIAAELVEQNHNPEPVAAPANFMLADVRPFEVGAGGRASAFTQFYELERQPDGTWKLGPMIMGTFEPMHRSDITRSPGR